MSLAVSEVRFCRGPSLRYHLRRRDRRTTGFIAVNGIGSFGTAAFPIQANGIVAYFAKLEAAMKSTMSKSGNV